MAVTSYISINGMIVGESTGGVNRAYGPDALGSVVATYTGSALENTYQYKPYGGLLSKTGVAADPSFLWNGGSGYRATSLINAEYFTRRRHFSSITGEWTTVDPTWPKQSAYTYVQCRPLLLADFSGLDPSGGCGSQVDNLLQPKGCDLIASYYGNKCNLGNGYCKLVADMKVTGTLSFDLKSTCFIGLNNPCLETMALNCNKHFEYPVPPNLPSCTAPAKCIVANRCNYNVSTSFSDPGPIVGSYPDPLHKNKTCTYTISNIQFTGSLKVAVVAALCIKPIVTHAG